MYRRMLTSEKKSAAVRTIHPDEQNSVKAMPLTKRKDGNHEERRLWRWMLLSIVKERRSDKSNSEEESIFSRRFMLQVAKNDNERVKCLCSIDTQGLLTCEKSRVGCFLMDVFFLLRMC